MSKPFLTPEKLYHSISPSENLDNYESEVESQNKVNGILGKKLIDAVININTAKTLLAKEFSEMCYGNITKGWKFVASTFVGVFHCS